MILVAAISKIKGDYMYNILNKTWVATTLK